ncbi:MAG: ABC transporter substrate-binding protein [Pyrinomonadaceae bacterium]
MSFLSGKGKWIVLLVVLSFVSLAVLRWRYARQPKNHTEEIMHRGPGTGPGGALTVAFIPVTCHLTCPVTDFASKTSTTGTRFDAMRFGEFPSIIEALKSKSLMAGFLTVPLAMKMREQGVPVKIVTLGHRDGSELIIRQEDPAKDLRELRGKTIAIPSPFSNENFFLNQMMRDQGVRPDEFKIVVLPPPDMPAALSAKAIDGYIVAEPFCAKAVTEGYGRVLYYAKDIWPNYISCCLVVHEDLIRDRPDVVRDLVRGINESGEWVERDRPGAAKVAATYFRQDEKLLNYILTQTPELVTYRNLNPTDIELQKIFDMGMSLGFFTKPLVLDQLIDRTFFPTNIQPAKVDLSKLSEMAPPPSTAPAK